MFSLLLMGMFLFLLIWLPLSTLLILTFQNIDCVELIKDLVKMRLYKDLFTGKDLCTDAFKMELVDDCYYAVTGKFIVEDNTVSDEMIGGNKSAEGVDDEGDDGEYKKIVPNVIFSNKLEERYNSDALSKDFKQLVKDMKPYIQKLLAKIAETDADRSKLMKESIQNFLKNVVKSNIGDFSFYQTEDDLDMEGQIIFFNGGDWALNSPCTLYFFKDGVTEENC